MTETCHAIPCHAMPCHAIPCHAMPCHVPCHTTIQGSFFLRCCFPVPSSPNPPSFPSLPSPSPPSLSAARPTSAHPPAVAQRVIAIRGAASLIRCSPFMCCSSLLPFVSPFTCCACPPPCAWLPPSAWHSSCAWFSPFRNTTGSATGVSPPCPTQSVRWLSQAAPESRQRLHGAGLSARTWARRAGLSPRSCAGCADLAQRQQTRSGGERLAEVAEARETAKHVAENAAAATTAAPTTVPARAAKRRSDVRGAGDMGWLRAATRNPIQPTSSHRLVSSSTTARRARAMSAVDAAWQRLKAATAPAAMAGSRLSASRSAAPPALPRGDPGGSAIAAALDGAAGSADLPAQATAGNPGETVKLRDARVELILTQRLRQRGTAQTASGASGGKKAVPVSDAREVQCGAAMCIALLPPQLLAARISQIRCIVVGVGPGLEAPYRSSPRVSHTVTRPFPPSASSLPPTLQSWVWDLGLRPLPRSAAGADGAGSDVREERSGGEAAGGAERALRSAERGGPGEGAGVGDGGARERGDMEVDGGGGGRSEEGNKEGDTARENATAAAAGAERAAAAAAALRATQAAAGGAVVDNSKVQVRAGGQGAQVREVVDFAGEAVEVVRVLDVRSKEAAAAKRKADMQASTSKGLDAILAQMEKKKKLNILDKSRKTTPFQGFSKGKRGGGKGAGSDRRKKNRHLGAVGVSASEFKDGAGVVEELEEHCRSGSLLPSHSSHSFPNFLSSLVAPCCQDWSEYKEGTGVVEELAEYRRSGATYTEKRAFLGQADLREYERERDAKLAAQARRARPGGVEQSPVALPVEIVELTAEARAAAAAAAASVVLAGRAAREVAERGAEEQDWGG
ncbi:unnamed protein product [Closterium sp. NIES-54]